MSSDEYIQSITAWREEVEHNLRRENSWLALAGLFWLHEGRNLAGSAPESEVLLPERMPARLGTFESDGEKVTLLVEGDFPVKVNDLPVTSDPLRTDQDDAPSFITFDDLRMVVVRRSKGIGIRLWDNARKERRLFPGRQWYPVKEAYRVPASYTRYKTAKLVKMPDILGSVLDEPMQGFVTFRLEGKKYELVAEELPDQRLFLPFMDLTSGKSTYPSGRYLYTDAHENGRLVIDFNKAYSPPCAFTPYATCTFPPPENRLAVAIEAGELYTGHSH